MRAGVGVPSRGAATRGGGGMGHLDGPGEADGVAEDVGAGQAAHGAAVRRRLLLRGGGGGEGLSGATKMAGIYQTMVGSS